MKGCILEANLVRSSAEISSKRGVSRKRGGGFESCSGWEGGKWFTLGKEGFTCGTRSSGKLYRLTIEWTSSKAVFKDFPYTLRVPSSLLRVYCITQKMHISQELAFLWITLHAMRHNSSVLFHLKLYMLWTKQAQQSANFQNCDCSHEN